MQKSKLIVCLKCLSTTDMQALDTFLRSPVFNTNPLINSLFASVKKYAPDYTASELNKKTLFKILYPHQTYKDSQLRLLMSELTQLIEHFWAFQHFQKDKNYHSQKLLDTYSYYRLDKFFVQTLNRHKKHQLSIKGKSIDDHLSDYHIQERQFQFDVFRRDRPFATSLQQVIEVFDVYYLANKLRYCCTILSRQQIYATNKKAILLFNEILAVLATQAFAHIPLISFYHQLLLLLYEPHNENHFFTLKKRLLAPDTIEKLSEFDLRQIYNGCATYCTAKVKRGNLSYYQHLYDIYGGLIATKLIFSDGYVITRNYGNIVTVALQLKKYAWAENFIKNYQHHLAPRYRKSVAPYNLGKLYFHQHHYNDALGQLLQVEFVDLFTHILCKKLQLQTYYELEATEALFSLVGNFRDLLKRKEAIAPTTRKAYRNFVNYTVKLYRIKEGQQRPIHKIKAEIEGLKLIHDKKWLLEKLEELLTK